MHFAPANGKGEMPATIKPHKVPEYTTKTPKDPLLPPTPLRAIILAPSGSGKTILIQNLICDLYRGCWARVFVFSPSVWIDMAWRPVIDYAKDDLKVDLDKEKLFFDKWDPDALQAILDEQAAMVKYQKKAGFTKLHGILVCVDDFSDDPHVMHSNTNLLAMLFLRGRHLACSTIISTQKFKATSTMLRSNAQMLIVFRLRNRGELQALLEELSAVYSTEALLRLYEYATDEPFSFLTVNLMARKKEDMFMLNFQKKIVAEE